MNRVFLSSLLSVLVVSGCGPRMISAPGGVRGGGIQYKSQLEKCEKSKQWQDMGVPFDETKIGSIKAGVTTIEEVENWFGPPSIATPPGISEMLYMYRFCKWRQIMAEDCNLPPDVKTRMEYLTAQKFKNQREERCNVLNIRFDTKSRKVRELSYDIQLSN